MAEVTGIGKIGKNGLLFNPRYGPRLMLGGIVTTASLPAIAWPEKDEGGCPQDCYICKIATFARSSVRFRRLIKVERWIEWRALSIQ
jgi:epoxyqueuosine reductase QueG